jgi:hypothetical protein
VNEIEYTYKNKTYIREFADSWQTLKPHELLAYTNALALKLSGITFYRNIFYHFLKLPPDVYFNLPSAYIEELSEKVKFLKAEKIPTAKLIIQKFNFKGRTWYGPGDDYRNLTIAEFAFIDTRLAKFQAKEDDSILCEIIYALYRKTSPIRIAKYWFNVADIRIPFNDRLAKIKACKLSNLPIKIKKAILYNFIGYRQYIVEKNPHVFQPPSDSEDMKGWPVIMHTMAGDKLGTFDQIQATSMNNALYLLKIIDNERKIKDRIKGIKKNEDE